MEEGVFLYPCGPGSNVAQVFLPKVLHLEVQVGHLHVGMHVAQPSALLPHGAIGGNPVQVILYRPYGQLVQLVDLWVSALERTVVFHIGMYDHQLEGIRVRLAVVPGQLGVPVAVVGETGRPPFNGTPLQVYSSLNMAP